MVIPAVLALLAGFFALLVAPFAGDASAADEEPVVAAARGTAPVKGY